MPDKIIENKNQHEPNTHRLVGSSLSGTPRHTSGQQAEGNKEANWGNREDRSRPGGREEYLKLITGMWATLQPGKLVQAPQLSEDSLGPDGF